MQGVSLVITKTAKSLPYTHNILARRRRLQAKCQRLQNDLAAYKHAFERTAAEFAHYKQAFMVAAAHRDRLNKSLEGRDIEKL